ncbi:MAG: hypothetical protein KBG28_01500 [Kofleriaceae bacterium]|nr:hypothetical protein [Kofleriaceae bacterium]
MQRTIDVTGRSINKQFPLRPRSPDVPGLALEAPIAISATDRVQADGRSNWQLPAVTDVVDPLKEDAIFANPTFSNELSNLEAALPHILCLEVQDFPLDIPSCHDFDESVITTFHRQ